MQNKIIKISNDKISHIRTSIYMPRVLYAEARRILAKRHVSFNKFVFEKMRELVKSNANN